MPDPRAAEPVAGQRLADQPRAHEPSAGHGDLPSRCSLRVAALETLWIFLIFFLVAASPPPDVGESHYLVKARHYWHPAWCAGDLFLESRDAHTVFYWSFGWVTRLVSLAAAAWIGRIVTWGLLAWSWQRLSWAVVPRPLASLLSAGLMLLLLRTFHLAGEWIVGGVEAKGFAYVLVLLALEAIARGRWRAALVLAGAAGAFHVLVGGWTAVAIALAWLITARDRPALITLLPAAIGGFALALPGLIPAVLLNAGVPAEAAREAARIYVFERLEHHLVYHSFPQAFIVRFEILAFVWLAMAWLLRRQPALARVERVVAGAVIIGLIGIVIDQALVMRANAAGQSTLDYELAAAGLLRYYWLRMSDSLVPIGLALAIVTGIDRLRGARPAAGSWLLMLAVVVAAGNVADVCFWRSRHRLPGAILQPRPTSDSWPETWISPRHKLAHGETSAAEWHRDWRAVCDWIGAYTPADALFLTPREQQTFKWYAGRAEVVNWKDIPQDARGILAWQERLQDIYPRDMAHRQHDLAAFTDDELVALANKFGARYLVLDRTRATRRLGLPLLYPLIAEENPSFAVYRIPEGRRQ
jgi:hypothetical protein